MVAQEVGPRDGPIVRKCLTRDKLRHVWVWGINHSSKKGVIFAAPERVAETVVILQHKIAVHHKAESRAV